MQTPDARFDSLLTVLSLKEPLCTASLAAADHRLTFAVGGSEDIYLADHREPNGAYVENGVQRVISLVQSLPEPPSLLRIDCRLSDCPPSRLHLPQPDCIREQSLYWQLSPDADLCPLFREIIRSELSPTGLECLCGSVFLLWEADPLILHLYDDRGLILAASDPQILQDLAVQFSHWLPV